ncbi:hypothetical protein C8J57DRAFT_1297564 [Mycena rebaudengoi]|nr:hypothetical protein C8J57DRAFT_1297564 [Mycena rebaudengoi]
MSIPGTSGGSVENANSELELARYKAERVIIDGSVQELLQSVLEELKSDRASVGSLRAATLPVSLAIAVKAGITTLAVAKTIAGTSPHPTTYSSCLNVLQQLSYVQNGHTIQPGPLTGFHAPRAASTMMAKPLSHNPLSQPRLHLYVQLEQELSRVGINGQDITDAFMLVDQGDQVRQDRNLVAHEMTIGTFLANFKCQMEVVNEKNLIVPVSWMKLQVLWRDVIGQDMLASAHAAEAGGIAPADLNICLYNISSTQTV